jgi:hypothetical protein
MPLQDNQIKMATEKKMRDARYGNLCGHLSSCFCVQSYASDHFGAVSIIVWQKAVFSAVSLQ